MVCGSISVLGEFKKRFCQFKIQREQFCADHNGSVSIEFSLLWPVFFGVSFAILVCGVMFFLQFALMTAAEYASRQLITGQVASNMSQEQFRQQVCKNLPAVMQCSDLMVDVQSAGVIDNLDTSTVNLENLKKGTNFNVGSGGDYVLVRLFYHVNLPLNFPGIGFIADTENSTFIMATMLAKAEPY